MTKNDKIIGSLSQRQLVNIYAKYVNQPKADFFSSLNLGLIQGKREAIWIEMLEGTDNNPPLKLIDCHTSGGVFNLGHRHPEIVKALKEGLDYGLDIGDHHLLSEQRALLAKKLAELFPGDITKTMFSVGGGEAIDLAIKLARGFTGRTKVISANRAYHGVTGFALGACAENFRKPFLWDMPTFKHVPFGDIDSLKNVLTEEDTACVIFETIPATGGILIPPKGYFKEVRELCDDNGAIFIIDEVQTGLGRTGELWGIYGGLYPDEKIVPDVIVLAKGMSCGLYPISTTSYRPFLEEVFEDDPFLHISTTGGSELGCYVTNKMLDIISEPNLLKNVKEMGKRFSQGLADIDDHNKIREVRGRGLMWGIEFNDEITSLSFTLNMIKNGVWCDYCGNHKVTNKFLPPLIINSDEIDKVLTRIRKTLKEI
jgi:putrescine aminotransferase